MTDNDDLALYGAKLTPHKDGTSMTRPLALAALALLAVTSCAATLRVSGTAPILGMEGTCVRPTYGDTLRSPMWVIGRVEVAGLMDSLWLEPGAPVVFQWQVPAGEYLVKVWARNAGGVACTTSVMAWATSRPAPVRLTP